MSPAKRKPLLLAATVFTTDVKSIPARQVFSIEHLTSQLLSCLLSYPQDDL